MAIHLKIITELDRRRAAREAAELKRDLEKSGRDSSEAWAKGFAANSPKIRAAWVKVAKAADVAADGQDRAARAMRNTQQVSQRMALKLQQDAEKIFDLEEKHRRSMDKTAKAEEAHAKSSQRLGTRRSREYIEASRKQIAASRKVDESLRNQQRLINEIADAEEHLAHRKMLSATKTDKDSLKKVADLEKRIIDLYEQKEKSLGAITDAEGVYSKAQQDREELTHRLTNAERENLRLLDQRNDARHQELRDLITLNRATRDSAAIHRDAAETVTKAQEAESDAMEKSSRLVRDHEMALKSASDTADDHSRAMDKLAKSHKGLGDYVGKNIAALTPLGRVSPLVGAGVGAIVASAAEAAVTASQSLALLPAAAAAAAAGIGTLTIGLHGFGDTIKDMGDPKKFAEGLATLSPNAQQAALEIKALVDGPLGDLKKATQDALFANVPEQLHNLTNVFGPTIEKMTTSIATSFNQMFMGLGDQLMKPDMQARIGEITTNITTMFQALQPAIGPFVDAFTRITQVGSQFLPQIAGIINDIATSFDNFIIRVQGTGQLSDFIQKGIDAAKALGSFLLEVGQDIYEVFGNKSPEEFRTTLESVRETIKVVLQAIVDLSEWINGTLIPAAQGFADIVGGWENVFTLVAGIFVASWLKSFAEVLGIKGLGGVTAALTGLPTAAESAVTGILGAFTRMGTITLPIVLGITAGAAGSHLLNTGHNVPVMGADGTVWDPNAPGGAGGTLPGTPQAPPQVPLIQLPPSTAGSREPAYPMTPNGAPALQPPPIDQTYAGPYQPNKPVPPIPGPPESKSARRDRLRQELAPESYKVDPYAGMTTGGPTAPSAYDPASTVHGNAPVIPAMGPGPGGLSPALNSLQTMLKSAFPQLNLGGVRADSLPYHPGGRALDIGIPNWNTPEGKSLGDTINAFLLQHAAQFGLESTIWQDFYQPASGVGGHPLGRMAQGPDEAHLTHIHAQTATGAQQPGTLGPVGPQYNAFGQQTGFGAYQVDPAEVQRKDFDVRNAAHNLEESKKDLLAAQADNTATAEEINDLEWKVEEKKQALLEAQQKLGEAQTGTFEKMKTSTSGMKDGMQQLGAELDKDFGISKGLPGLAENLTKFLANLAFAPALGALSAVTAVNGTAGKGSGILGALAPRENAFGQPMPNALGQYSPDQLTAMTTGGATGPSMYSQQPGGTPGYTNQQAAAAPHRLNWDAVMQGEADPNQGWATNTGNGFFGGLQFTQSSWDLAGGQQYAQRADLASPDEQKAVADALYDIQGPGAWPNTAWRGMQEGGTVPGYGNGDIYPALLEPGELVLPKDMVSPMGYVNPNGPRWGKLDPRGGKGKPGMKRPAGGWFGPGLAPNGPWYAPRGSWGKDDIHFPWEPRNPLDPHVWNRRGVFGAEGGGYLDEDGKWHPADPLQVFAPTGLPNKAPAFPVGPEGALGGADVGAGKPAETPGPFALLPGQKPPGEHQTYIPGQPLPGPAGPLATPGGPLNRPLPSPAVEELPTPAVGRAPGQGLNLPKGEGIKPGGGIIGLAESAAVSAAGAGGAMGGAGAVASAGAQIAIDEINRAIQYGGQVAGIAVQGLMETFLPNESPLADIGGGWVGRIAGAAAGASAAAPNLAGTLGALLKKKPEGESKPGEPPRPEDQVPPPGNQAPNVPGSPGYTGPTGPPPGPITTNNVNITAANADPNNIANTATQHLTAAYAAPGMR